MLIIAVACLSRATQADSPASAPDGGKKIVVAVAPFVSVGDDGTWGKAATDAFQKKLIRWPLTEPIDRFSYADLAEQEHVDVRWDTPVATVAKFARDTLGAKVFIYGDVKVADAKGQSATLRVRAIDLRAGPTLAADRTFEISYPTQLRPAVEMVLNQLVGYSTVNMEVPALVHLTADMEQRWKDGANLAPNPDFLDADKAGRLARWEAVIADQRYAPENLKFEGPAAPIGNDLRRQCMWATSPGDEKTRTVHMAINEDVASTYGMACYSDWIAISPGCIYRFTCRWKVEGPTPKVFIKGYALRPTVGEKEGAAPMSWQRREVYRRQVHPTSDADPKVELGNGWFETTADFCPRHDQFPPHWVRIDLYAYYPKGRAWFSHIVLKKLSDKPAVEQHDPPDIPADPTTVPDSK
jgi:hypothetical protein